MSPTQLRAAIFDYGGVLTTSGRAALADWTRQEGIRRETYTAALKEWLAPGAPPGNPIHLLETGEIDAEEFNRALAARLRTTDGGPVAPDDLLGRLFGHMRSDEEMLRLVRDLRGQGVRTALLSNSWGNEYPWELLDGLFEVAVISGEVGLRKPDPRIYRLTLEKLGLAPHEAVFVDDGPQNVEAAQDIGLHAILHTDAASTRAALAGLQTHHAQENR